MLEQMLGKYQNTVKPLYLQWFYNYKDLYLYSRREYVCIDFISDIQYYVVFVGMDVGIKLLLGTLIYVILIKVISYFY